MNVFFPVVKSLLVLLFLFNPSRSSKGHEQDLSGMKKKSTNEFANKDPPTNEISPFTKLINEKTFIDKTEFTKSYMDSSEKFLVLAAPPKFGKTHLLDILRLFLDAETAADGSIRLPTSSTKNYKLFEKTKLFRNHREFFLKHHQMYKVLFIDFNGLRQATRLTGRKDLLCSVICPMMMRYSYLKKAGSKLEWFNYTANNNECFRYCRSDTEESLAVTGLILSEELSNIYKKDVIVLCDNYDILIDAILLNGAVESVAMCNALTLLQDFFRYTWKNNRRVVRCLMMGTSSLGQALTIGADVKHRRFDEMPGFAKYSGFSQEDVDDLLARFGKSGDRDDVKLWYGGYTIKNSPNTTLYNPQSIVSFLQKGKLKGYIEKEASRNKFLGNLFSHPQMGSVIQRIVSGDSPNYRFSDKRPDWKTLVEMREFMSGENEKYADMDIEFMQFLTEQGFFTRQNGRPEGSNYLILPNLEVREYIDKILFDSHLMSHAASWLS